MASLYSLASGTVLRLLAHALGRARFGAAAAILRFHSLRSFIAGNQLPVRGFSVVGRD